VKALDTSSETIGQAKKIAAAGCGAVGVYLRLDRCSAAMLAELHNGGLQVWSIYEKGYPTSDDYFSAYQGSIDGHAAAAFAQSMGQLLSKCVSGNFRRFVRCARDDLCGTDWQSSQQIDSSFNPGRNP
jgi:hypothetical protein